MPKNRNKICVKNYFKRFKKFVLKNVSVKNISENNPSLCTPLFDINIFKYILSGIHRKLPPIRDYFR